MPPARPTAPGWRRVCHRHRRQHLLLADLGAIRHHHHRRRRLAVRRPGVRRWKVQYIGNSQFMPGLLGGKLSGQLTKNNRDTPQKKYEPMLLGPCGRPADPASAWKFCLGDFELVEQQLLICLFTVQVPCQGAPLFFAIHQIPPGADMKKYLHVIGIGHPEQPDVSLQLLDADAVQLHPALRHAVALAHDLRRQQGRERARVTRRRR